MSKVEIYNGTSSVDGPCNSDFDITDKPEGDHSRRLSATHGTARAVNVIKNNDGSVDCRQCFKPLDRSNAVIMRQVRKGHFVAMDFIWIVCRPCGTKMKEDSKIPFQIIEEGPALQALPAPPAVPILEPQKGEPL